MLLADQMADECLVVDVESFAILAVFKTAFVDVLVIVPSYQFSLGVFLLEAGLERLFKALDIKQRSRPPHEIDEVVVKIAEIGCILGLMLELFVDGEIIKLIHIL